MSLIQGLSRKFDRTSEQRIPGQGPAHRKDFDCELDALGNNN